MTFGILFFIYNEFSLNGFSFLNQDGDSDLETLSAFFTIFILIIINYYFKNGFKTIFGG